MSSKYPTIYDIAKELNITASTVSRALCNHPKISDLTKKIVLETAERLNYKPNSIASSLRRGKGNTIGVIIPLINRTYFANIIQGIESIANEAGYHIIISQSNESIYKESESIKTLVNNRVSGILISVSAETKDSSHFEPAIKSGIPIVQFDRVLESFHSSMIYNDDYLGAYNSVIHLIDQGFKDIIHFAGPLHLSMYKNRMEGYKKALADRSIIFNPNLIFEGIISREKGFDLSKTLIQNGIKADAIFAASDLSALGAISALKEMRINIPENFGVAGYVNELFAEYIDPSLTSTEQFGDKIGKIAAEVLMEDIAQKGNANPKTKIIQPELIIRKSTNRKKVLNPF